MFHNIKTFCIKTGRTLKYMPILIYRMVMIFIMVVCVVSTAALPYAIRSIYCDTICFEERIEGIVTDDYRTNQTMEFSAGKHFNQKRSMEIAKHYLEVDGEAVRVPWMEQTSFGDTFSFWRYTDPWGMTMTHYRGYSVCHGGIWLLVAAVSTYLLLCAIFVDSETDERKKKKRAAEDAAKGKKKSWVDLILGGVRCFLEVVLILYVYNITSHLFDNFFF